MVIRPDDNTAPSDFTTASQTITCATSPNRSGTQSGSVSFTGEQIWANLYSIGTIEPDTHIYLYQGKVSDASRARVHSISDYTQDWWSSGHIDVCVFTKDFKQTAYPIIDTGYIKAFARKGTTYYDNFETSTSSTSGGRNPVPINTAADLDNSTGYKSITFASGTVDDFNVGDEINGGSSGARAIITKIEGTWQTYTIHYFLLDDPQTDFSSSGELITDVDATGSATKDANPPADQGPATTSWFTNAAFPSISFGNTTYDVDDDGTDEYYGVTINCNNNPLSEVYEWLKYITRNGGTTTTNTDGIEGEQYVGAEAYLEYSGSVSGGTIAEGDDVLQATSLATGIVVAHDTANKVLLLRDVRGTFSTAYTVTSQDAGAGTITPDTAATNFAPNKQSPFGSFPGGGTFFGSRGVLLENWVDTDENSFSLIPVDGGTKQRPQAYSITVTNLVGTDETTITDDRVTVFRLTGSGGNINKEEFDAYGGEIPGATTLDVAIPIPANVPGKTAGGVLRIRDNNADNQNYRIRYSSWLNNGGGGTDGRFTLANIDIAAATGGSTTTVVETGAFTNAKRGDLVYNHDLTEVTYVVSVDSANQITVYPAFSVDPTGDHIELNCVPITMNDTGTDDVYVPLMDRYATDATESVSIQYVSTIYFRARVRNVAATSPDGPIKPFEANSSLGQGDVSVQTIRTLDTIYTVGS